MSVSAAVLLPPSQAPADCLVDVWLHCVCGRLLFKTSAKATLMLQVHHILSFTATVNIKNVPGNSETCEHVRFIRALATKQRSGNLLDLELLQTWMSGGNVFI